MFTRFALQLTLALAIAALAPTPTRTVTASVIAPLTAGPVETQLLAHGGCIPTPGGDKHLPPPPPHPTHPSQDLSV
jgi:hypothetical protein